MTPDGRSPTDQATGTLGADSEGSARVEAIWTSGIGRKILSSWCIRCALQARSTSFTGFTPVVGCRRGSVPCR